MKKTPRTPENMLAQFPPALRALIDAELAAGNTVVEISSCFPAPPAGAYVKLANFVTTRARQSAEGLSFYERRTSAYSGEWTDEKRHFFVLEPAREPEPEPDMDAIRAQRDAAARRAVPPSSREGTSGAVQDIDWTPAEAEIRRRVSPLLTSEIIRRFEASMKIDYEKWHDGIGYDMDALREANAAERELIESLLLGRAQDDWRDVEALATLGTQRAQAALRAAFAGGNAEIRGAVLRYAPNLVQERNKIDHLIEALRTAEFYGGLSQALDQVEEDHPPEVMTELWRGALNREGGIACHFAGMLLYLHGRAREPFDWDHRPFLLRFNTTDRAQRVVVFRELAARVGVDPAPYLVGAH